MAELHRKQYPYPDVCIFLVTGGLVKNNQTDLSTIQPLIVVAQDEAAAVDGWRGITAREPGWEPLSCTSMAQLNLHRSKLLDAQAHPDAYAKVLSTNLFGIGLKSRAPWMVAFDGKDGAKGANSVVMASSMSDIESWADKKGESIASALPLSIIEATWLEMKQVQGGKAERENYVQGAQDWADVADRVDQWSDEKTKRFEEASKRLNAKKAQVNAG